MFHFIQFSFQMCAIEIKSKSIMCDASEWLRSPI